MTVEESEPEGVAGQAKLLFAKFYLARQRWEQAKADREQTGTRVSSVGTGTDTGQDRHRRVALYLHKRLFTSRSRWEKAKASRSVLSEDTVTGFHQPDYYPRDDQDGRGVKRRQAGSDTSSEDNVDVKRRRQRNRENPGYYLPSPRHVTFDYNASELTDEHMKSMADVTADITVQNLPRLYEISEQSPSQAVNLLETLSNERLLARARSGDDGKLSTKLGKMWFPRTAHDEGKDEDTSDAESGTVTSGEGSQARKGLPSDARKSWKTLLKEYPQLHPPAVSTTNGSYLKYTPDEYLEFPDDLQNVLQAHKPSYVPKDRVRSFQGYLEKEGLSPPASGDRFSVEEFFNLPEQVQSVLKKTPKYRNKMPLKRTLETLLNEYKELPKPAGDKRRFTPDQWATIPEHLQKLLLYHVPSKVPSKRNGTFRGFLKKLGVAKPPGTITFTVPEFQALPSNIRRLMKEQWPKRCPPSAWGRLSPRRNLSQILKDYPGVPRPKFQRYTLPQIDTMPPELIDDLIEEAPGILPQMFETVIESARMTRQTVITAKQYHDMPRQLQRVFREHFPDKCPRNVLPRVGHPLLEEHPEIPPPKNQRYTNEEFRTIPHELVYAVIELAPELLPAGMVERVENVRNCRKRKRQIGTTSKRRKKTKLKSPPKSAPKWRQQNKVEFARERMLMWLEYGCNRKRQCEECDICAGIIRRAQKKKERFPDMMSVFNCHHPIRYGRYKLGGQYAQMGKMKQMERWREYQRSEIVIACSPGDRFDNGNSDKKKMKTYLASEQGILDGEKWKQNCKKPFDLDHYETFFGQDFTKHRNYPEGLDYLKDPGFQVLDGIDLEQVDTTAVGEPRRMVSHVDSEDEEEEVEDVEVPATAVGEGGASVQDAVLLIEAMGRISQEESLLVDQQAEV